MLNLFKKNKDLAVASAVMLLSFVSEGIGIYHARKAVTDDTAAKREAHQEKANAFMIAGAVMFPCGLFYTGFRLRALARRDRELEKRLTHKSPGLPQA